MKGIHVKNKLVKNGYVLAEVAKNMGVIPQTLQSLLAAEDIKTGVLENIARAISKNVYFFFEGLEEGAVPETREAEGIEKLIEVIHNQSNQLSTSQKQIDRLLSLLEETSQKGAAGDAKGVAPMAAHG